MRYKVLAFDFDGTITNYRGDYRGDSAHESPNVEMVKAMTELRARGYKLIIHSTKSAETIRAYCEEHGIPFDYINENPEMEQGNPGKPRAGAYIDDRAICYEGQDAEKLVEMIERFEPFYARE